LASQWYSRIRLCRAQTPLPDHMRPTRRNRSVEISWRMPLLHDYSLRKAARIPGFAGFMTRLVCRNQKRHSQSFRVGLGTPRRRCRGLLYDHHHCSNTDPLYYFRALIVNVSLLLPTQALVSVTLRATVSRVAIENKRIQSRYDILILRRA